MGLTNGVGERIPERLRRLPHFTSKILLQGSRVEGYSASQAGRT